MIPRHWNIRINIQLLHPKHQVSTVRIVFFVWNFWNLNVKKMAYKVKGCVNKQKQTNDMAVQWETHYKQKQMHRIKMFENILRWSQTSRGKPTLVLEKPNEQESKTYGLLIYFIFSLLVSTFIMGLLYVRLVLRCPFVHF